MGGSTCAIYISQASKLGLGKNSGIISYYSNHQVVQFNYSPLVVTFVAQASANTGELEKGHNTNNKGHYSRPSLTIMCVKVDSL